MLSFSRVAAFGLGLLAVGGVCAPLGTEATTLIVGGNNVYEDLLPGYSFAFFNADGTDLKPFSTIALSDGESGYANAYYNYHTNVQSSGAAATVKCKSYVINNPGTTATAYGPLPNVFVDVAVTTYPVVSKQFGTGLSATKRLFNHKLACAAYSGPVVQTPTRSVYFVVRPIDSLPQVNARVSWITFMGAGQSKASVPFLSSLHVTAAQQFSIAQYIPASVAVSKQFVAFVPASGAHYLPIASVAGCEGGASDSTQYSAGLHYVKCYVYDVTGALTQVTFTIDVRKEDEQLWAPASQWSPPAGAIIDEEDNVPPTFQSRLPEVQQVLTPLSSGVPSDHIYVAPQAYLTSGQACASFPGLKDSLFASDSAAGEINGLTGTVSGLSPIICSIVGKIPREFEDDTCFIPGTHTAKCVVFDFKKNPDQVTFKFIVNAFAAPYEPPCVPGQAGCVNGDPQFTGFLGQSYQIHGVSGQNYNILSTPTFQYNALFSYLESGSCRKGTMCFSHPGNYFGQVGVMLKNGAEVMQIQVIAGPVDVGMQVLVNGAMMNVSSTPLMFGESTVFFASAFDVQVQSAEFSMRLSNSDMFINQDISINNALLASIQQFKQSTKAGNGAAAAQLEAVLPHGLLGQTWQFKSYDNRWKYIQGTLFEYVTMDGLMGTEFKYNRFQL